MYFNNCGLTKSFWKEKLKNVGTAQAKLSTPQTSSCAICRNALIQLVMYRSKHFDTYIEYQFLSTYKAQGPDADPSQPHVRHLQEVGAGAAGLRSQSKRRAAWLNFRFSPITLINRYHPDKVSLTKLSRSIDGFNQYPATLAQWRPAVQQKVLQLFATVTKLDVALNNLVVRSRIGWYY